MAIDFTKPADPIGDFDALIETIAANGARATGSGSAILTIDPVTDHGGADGYYPTFEEGGSLIPRARRSTGSAGPSAPASPTKLF